MLDWLIIGGGMHGTAHSLALTKRLGIPRDHVRVLDAHTIPLAAWKHNTHNVGMRFLRSPGVHHLHFDPFSHRTFAQTPQGKPLMQAIPRYERPSLAFFSAYTDYLFARYGLAELRLQGRAAGLRRLRDGWQVESDQGTLTARNVLLAISTGEALHIPAWAHAVPRIHHIFAPHFKRDSIPHNARVAVVGGGISAVQTALALADAGRDVTLLARHPRRVHDFDSEPCWVVNICLQAFHRLTAPDERRALIQQVRHRGSIPPDVAALLDAALQAGRIRMCEDEVLHAQTSVRTHSTDSVTLTLRSGDVLCVDDVVLCTGFSASRPGGAWVDVAIMNYGLPIAACGYPVVDASLRWADGLYVTGALAELEIGPVSRNLIGARLAGERLRHVL